MNSLLLSALLSAPVANAHITEVKHAHEQHLEVVPFEWNFDHFKVDTEGNWHHKDWHDFNLT